MSIQWFPGHMHKARQELAAMLPSIDAVIELLDARIPWSSENPMLASLVADKPVLRLLSKSDLADPAKTDLWLQLFKSETQCDALALDLSNPTGCSDIMPALRALPVKADRYRIKPFVVMVVGIPNVGKSTLLNRLSGRSVAKTGNEPAITKRQQLIKLNEQWSLCDTPGVLWPKVDNVASGYRLAATGAIRDTAIDSADVCLELLEHLNSHYPDLVLERFGQSIPLTEPLHTLEAIGHSRGCLGGGGLVDHDRTGRLVLQEFREGKLGAITLETPAMRDQEQLVVQEQKALREAQQLERQLQRKKKRKRVSRQ